MSDAVEELRNQTAFAEAEMCQAVYIGSHYARAILAHIDALEAERDEWRERADKAAADERAAVVMWLRKEAKMCEGSPDQSCVLSEAADAIESRQHHTT